MLIIDASAAYQAFFEERRDQALRADSELLAPDLIVCELLNARWKSIQGQREVPSVNDVLNFLKRIRIVPALQDAVAAAELSERLSHPVYDCFYIALALRQSAKLVTNDGRLVRKLRAHKLDSLLA